MDRFEAMSILVAIADGGSLSQASRQLKIPLATVSRKLTELEHHLKVKLLTRTTRALEFTDYGNTYVTLCRRILDEVGEAERLVTGEYMAPKGLLTITAPIVYGKLHVVPILAEFLKAYPEVNVQLWLTDRMVDLLEEKIDLAVRIGELSNSSLIATRVSEIRQVTCGSPNYFKKYGKPESLTDLISHQCINITAISSNKRWNYLDCNIPVSIPIHPRLEVTTAEAGLEAAARGIGITRALSYQMIDLLGRNKLEIVLQDYEPDPLPVHLVHSAGRMVPLKLRAFLDFANPRLKQA